MSESEWESLPEVSNMLGNRVKKPRLEGRSYVVPDSVITGARDSSALESSLAGEQMVSYFFFLLPFFVLFRYSSEC